MECRSPPAPTNAAAETECKRNAEHRGNFTARGMNFSGRTWRCRSGHAATLMMRRSAAFAGDGSSATPREGGRHPANRPIGRSHWCLGLLQTKGCTSLRRRRRTASSSCPAPRARWSSPGGCCRSLLRRPGHGRAVAPRHRARCGWRRPSRFAAGGVGG